MYYRYREMSTVIKIVKIKIIITKLKVITKLLLVNNDKFKGIYYQNYFHSYLASSNNLIDSQ